MVIRHPENSVMTDRNFTPPTGWIARNLTSDETLTEYECQITGDATFIITVTEDGDATKSYKLQFSTITPESPQTRHDYPIGEYKSRTNALTDATTLMQDLTTGLQNGTISPDDPEVDTIREVLQEFTDENGISTVRKWVRRLRRLR